MEQGFHASSCPVQSHTAVYNLPGAIDGSGLQSVCAWFQKSPEEGWHPPLSDALCIQETQHELHKLWHDLVARGSASTVGVKAWMDVLAASRRPELRVSQLQPCLPCPVDTRRQMFKLEANPSRGTTTKASIPSRGSKQQGSLPYSHMLLHTWCWSAAALFFTGTGQREDTLGSCWSFLELA